MALEVTMDNYNELVVNSDKPVLLDFYAEWCGPCKALIPIMDELSNDFADKAVIAKVNVEDCRDIGAEFGIMAIPTVVVMNKGQFVKKVSGVLKKKDYEDMINDLL